MMAARGVSLLALLCALLPAASGDSASTCAQNDDAAQCSALAAIYESTNGAQWTRSAGWLKGGSYCGWEGVTCAGRDVQALNLTKNGLTGELHAGIATLTNLTQLNLWGNQLSGSLPDALGRLAKLRDLNIYENKLSGTLPWEIGLLKSLVGLRAAHNELSGTIPCVGSLAHLEALHLFNNQLTGGLELAELGQLPRLAQLDLANNKLTGKIPGSLCPFVKRVAVNISKSPMTCNLGGENMSWSCPLPCGMSTTVCDAKCA